MKKKQEAEAPSPKISIKQNVIKGLTRSAATRMVESALDCDFYQAHANIGAIAGILAILQANQEEE